MRAALLALVLLAPFALAQDYDFKVLPLEPATVRAGDAYETRVETRHTCPVTGTVRMLAGGDPEIEATIADAPWSECGDDGYHRASSTLRLRVLPTARAGVHGLAVGAHWGGHTASTPLKVTVPYRATVEIDGPAQGIVLPGRSIEVGLAITVKANGDTWLVIATDAPRAWEVLGTGAVDVKVVNGTGTLRHAMRFTPSSDAYGDVPVLVSAVPHDGLTHQERGAFGTHRWTARLPPKLVNEEPPPAADAARPGGGDAGLPPPAPADPPDDDVPAWAIAALLIAAGAGAFLWTRRRPSS